MSDDATETVALEPIIHQDEEAAEPARFTYPKRPYKSIFFSVALFLLVVELGERCAYYGNRQGLNNFINEKNYLNMGTQAGGALTAMNAQLYYAWGVLGAIIADRWLGRFKTLLFSQIIYILGLWCMAIAAIPTVMSKGLFFFGMLVLFDIAGGAIKANLSTFGGDQFDMDVPAQRKEQKAFFSWFYWCINVGAAIAYGVMSQIPTGATAIPIEMGYFGNFAIASSVMVVAFIIFLIGSPRYVQKPIENASIDRNVAILKASFSTSGGKAFFFGIFSLVLAFFLSLLGPFVDLGNWPDSVRQFSVYSSFIFIAFAYFSILPFCSQPKWLDQFKKSNDGEFEDVDVKDTYDFVRTFPVVLIATSLWTVNGLSDGTGQNMAQQSDMRWNKDDCSSPQIPGPMLNILNTMTIIFVLPILEGLIYPKFGKPSIMKRITIGLCFASLGCIWCAFMEPARRASALIPCDPTQCGEFCQVFGSNNQTFLHGATGGKPMSDFSFTNWLPLYILPALGESFLSPATYELFYVEVGPSLRSLCFALNLMSYSFGGMFESLIYGLWKPQITNNLNDGHAEFVMWTAFILCITVIVLQVLWVGRRFEPRVEHRQLLIEST